MVNTVQLLKEAAIDRNNGEEDKAIEKYEKALSIFEKADDKTQIADTLQMIGVCNTISRDFAKALEKLTKALEIFTSIDDNIGIGNANRNIGIVHFHKKDYANALTCMSKSELSLRKAKDLEALGITQIKLGTVYLKLEQLQQARTYITKGLVNVRKEGNWFYEMTAFLHLAEHRFIKEEYLDMISLAWAGIGLIYDANEERKQQRRLIQLYCLLSWGYLKTDNEKNSKRFLEKAQVLLDPMPKNVREVLEEETKIAKLKKALR